MRQGTVRFFQAVVSSHFFFIFGALFLLCGLASEQAYATANYVYHERTVNDPGCGGQYVSTLNPSSADAVTIRFKVEYQYYTTNAALYYTTDGSNPSGAFGSATGTTQVINANWVCIFNAGNNVDVWEATIPAQQGGKTVKYIISSWHSGGGAEIFANSGEFISPFTTSSQATQFSYTVTCPTITFNETTLSNGIVGTLYNHLFTVSGGTPSHTFAVTAGALPAGLSLTPGGSLDGTPTTAGTYNFTVTATDANGCTGEQAYSLIINEPPLAVKSITPSQNASNISKSSSITVTFNKAVNTGTLIASNIVIGGPLSGRHFGSITLLGDTGFVFNPDEDFEDAENINVTITKNVQAGSGEYLTNGYHSLFTVQAQAGTGGFVLNNLYPMNTGMQGITSGDWDNDGDIDLAVPVNSSDHRLYVMYNDGTGHFFKQETLYVASSLWRVRSGDLDNDGDLDIVGNCNTNYGGPGESFIYTFLNDGVGNFTLSADRIADVGGVPWDMDLGDLDGDGDLDILLPCYNSNTASVLKNNGSGGFSLYSHFGLIGYGLVGDASKLADLNGDGYLDGIVGNSDQPFVRFLYNTGQGDFTQDTASLPGTHNFPALVNAGDFNSDGIVEVIAGGMYAGYNALLTNDGYGNFTFGFDLSNGGNKSVVTDVDGDGDLDFVPTHGNYNIGVYKNNGAASFPDFNLYGHGGADPFGITFADLDGDGDPDLATGNYSSPNVSVLFNDYGCPSIALDPPLSVPNSTENASYSQTFTVTGSVESFNFIISSGTLPPGLTLTSAGVLSGTTTTLGTYTFTVTAVRGNGCSASKTYTLVVGEPPIAVESTSPTKNALNVSVSSDVAIEFNKALNTGSVTSSSFVVEGSYSGRYNGTITFSGDTVASFDPVVEFRKGEQISVRLAKTIKSASGDSLLAGYRFSFTAQAVGGTGSFTHTQNITLGTNAVGGTAADLDNDGDIDLIAGTSAVDSFTIMLNNGSGGFTNYRLAGGSGIFGEERHTIVADFDGDGDPDILAGLNQGYTTAQLVMYFNDGTGHFPTREFSQMNGYGYNLTVGDWDGDMDIDLAVYSPTYTQPRVVFLKNDGSGNFTETLFITMTWGDYNYSGNIVNFDYDGDGDLDVLCGSGYGSYVGVFVNDGTGNFSSSPMYRGSNPKLIYNADFDNDEDIDLAVLHTVTYRYLEILKNNGFGVFIQTDSIVGTPTFSVGGMADVDGDGDIDITAIDENNRFEVLKNDGTGAFTQTQSFLYGGLDAAVAEELPVGDIDGDGDMDAATMNYSSPNVSILLNNFSCPTITLSPSTLSDAAVDSAYSQTITASPGTSPLSFAVTSGSLPAGLNLSTSGLLSGTPTLAGTSIFTITVTDVNGCTGVQACTLSVVDPCASTLDQQQPDNGGGSYSGLQSNYKLAQTLTPSQSGTLKKIELYLDNQGAGGDLIIELQSTVSTSAPSFGGSCGNLTRNVPTGTVLATMTIPSSSITTTSQFYTLEFPTPATVTGGTTYALVLSQNGGGYYRWFQVGGSATDTYTGGLSLTLESGNPTWNVNEAVQPNSCNFTAYRDMAFKTYLGGCSAPPCPTITLLPETLPGSIINESFSQTLTADSGTNPRHFAVTSGSLPTGLSINDNGSNGAIFGTPTTAGTYTFTVTVTDANGCTGSREYTITICPQITIEASSFAEPVKKGTFASQTYTASGGTAPYTYSILTGTLPPGMNLASNGILSGTPTTVGNSDYTIQATDSNGCTGTIGIHFVVSCADLLLDPLSNPGGTVGMAFSQTYIVTGNSTPPFTFDQPTGTLPRGLTLSTDGTLSGTPDSAATYVFGIRAFDSTGCTAAHEYTMVISMPAPGSVSGMKWNDLNGNGVRDTLEPGIANWNIYLTGSRIDSILTDSVGYYSFVGLPEGTYTVTEENREGWSQTYPTDPTTYGVTLAAGQNVTGKDFGNHLREEDAPPFTFDPPEILDGVNEFCTPLIMNTRHTSSETWFVKASGGDLTLTLYAHAVNNVDPESVYVEVYDASNILVTGFGVGYTAAEVAAGGIGFEKSIFVNLGARTPGEILRFVVTTPAPTPPTQPHYRFHFGGAVSAAINSPSFPGFEEEYARWYFNVLPTEDFNLDFFTTDMPTPPADTVFVRIVGPGGVFSPASGMYPIDGTTEINIPGAATGVWAVAIEHINGHYRLDKTTGADRGIYVSQFSGGCGEKVVNITHNGSPNDLPVNITLSRQVAT
ncbi:MAG: hypothetical protein EPO24_06160, partial [Bacteroidetes bacterium]